MIALLISLALAAEAPTKMDYISLESRNGKGCMEMLEKSIDAHEKFKDRIRLLEMENSNLQKEIDVLKMKLHVK
jgi:hypothetical protein